MKMGLQLTNTGNFEGNILVCNNFFVSNVPVQFGPKYAEKRRRMGPSGRFCRFNNVPREGDSAAEAAHSCRHPAPNAGPHHSPLPVFAVNNPATEEKDNPGWSHSETFTCSQDTS